MPRRVGLPDLSAAALEDPPHVEHHRPAVTPRRDGDPEVDLTAVRLVHRAMLADVRAVADLADRVAGGTATLRDRGTALRRYADRLCAEIDSLHDAEGGELWPVVAASAGAAVDLSDLADDHHAIDPVLARCRTAAGHPHRGRRRPGGAQRCSPAP